MPGTDGSSALRERLDPTRRVARLQRRAVEQAGEAVERATGPADAVASGIEDAGTTLGDGLRAMLRAAAAVPSALAWALGLLAGVLDRLAESGRTVAHRVEPPRAERRRRRLTSAALFAGGFGAGAAVGWIVHRELSDRQDPADQPR